MICARNSGDGEPARQPADEAPEEINLRNEIAKGGESRNIDLRGSGKRRLRQAEFWYEKEGILNVEAEVKPFGLR